MRISPVSNYAKNQSFGIISSKAIDAVRRQAEGFVYDDVEEAEYYLINKNYQLASEDELKKLDKLVKRAADLKKTVIHSQDMSNLEILTQDSLSYRYIERADNKKDKFQKAYESLEQAVIEAEQIEEDDSISDIRRMDRSNHAYDFDLCNQRYMLKSYYRTPRGYDNFKSSKANEALDSMYQSAKNIKRFKPMGRPSGYELGE